MIDIRCITGTYKFCDLQETMAAVIAIVDKEEHQSLNMQWYNLIHISLSNELTVFRNFRGFKLERHNLYFRHIITDKVSDLTNLIRYIIVTNESIVIVHFYKKIN